MRLFATAALAFILASCSAEAPPPSETTETPAPTPPVDANAITSEGWGPLRIGMTRAEVTAAVGPTATPNAAGGADPESCDLYHPERTPEGMLVMIQRGVLTSITVRNNTELKTDRGFGIGDTASAIKAAYGSSARAEPHHYVGLPAEYITVWTNAGSVGPNEHGYIDEARNPDARGIRYETNAEGVVTGVNAGGPTIQYVEGCS
jgi:hypothetical protein